MNKEVLRFVINENVNGNLGRGTIMNKFGLSEPEARIYAYIAKNIQDIIEVAKEEGDFSHLTPVQSRPNILLLDIETSLLEVYAWGLGKTRLNYEQLKEDWFIHSWAAKWLMEPDMYSEIQTADEAIAKDDRRIVEAMWKFLDHADIVIGHNAKHFDLRKLNARFMYYNLNPPSPYQVIDTLKVMQSMAMLTSNKQKALCIKFGLTNKMEHEGLDLWKKCLVGDQEALDTMLEYNKIDVVGLEELYLYIRKWIKSHPNIGLYMDNKSPTCTNCGSTNVHILDKMYATPMNLFSSFRCECGAIGRCPSSALTKEQKQHLLRPVAR